MKDSTKFYLLFVATAVLLGIGIPVLATQDDDSEQLAGVLLTVLGSISFAAAAGQGYLMYAAKNGGNTDGGSDKYSGPQRLKRFEVL